QDILHADETSLQVLSEPERPATSKSYMWLYRTGRMSPAIILYDYQRTRAAKHPSRFLKDFQGYIHVDGYAGYNGIAGVTLVGCLAHARRKFTEALQALPESAKTTHVKAKEGLAFCNQLFGVTSHAASPFRMLFQHGSVNNPPGYCRKVHLGKQSNIVVINGTV